MAVVAAIVLSTMMLLTVADVGGRYFFSHPIKGTYELIGLLLICAGTWGMAYCESRRTHIRVGILVDKLSTRIRNIVNALAYLIALGAFSIITWQMAVRAAQYISAGKGGISETLGLPFGPFYLIFAIGAGMFCLMLLLHLIKSLAEVIRC